VSDGNCDVLQSLFVESKLETSKELSQYIEELNVSLEEKRVAMHLARKSLLLLFTSLAHHTANSACCGRNCCNDSK